MKRTVETPMTFEDRVNNTLMPIDSAEELDWLMSLALDDALDAHEAARLDVLLAQSGENLERWAQWQMVDNDFVQMPSVLPPNDFAEKFALRLEIQERQRRLRTGVIFGIAAVGLWGSALVGIFMLGALLVSNQGVWMAGLIHNTAYWWAAMGQFSEAWIRTLETLLAAPQARVIIVCYVVAALTILVGWFAFLRRSTREMPLADAPMMEA